jgi:hypothetical protein
MSKDLDNWLAASSANVEPPYSELLRLSNAKIKNRDLRLTKLQDECSVQAKRIAELEKSLRYAEDFNSAVLENLMRSGAIAIIEAVWEGDILCPKIIMLDCEQSYSIKNYLHI